MIVGGRIAPVHRLRPVEARVAPGNVVRVEVGDVALGIGEDRVVGRVGVQVHELLERRVVLRLGAGVGLDEGVDVVLHQADAHPPVAHLPLHRAVHRVVGGERLPRHAGGGLVRNHDLFRPHGEFLPAVLVVVPVAALGDGLQKFVDVVHAAAGVHPAGGGVEPLIDEELSPGHGAIGVEPLVARHLEFGAEVERRVRVDVQQRVAVQRVLRRDGDAVGSRGFGPHGRDIPAAPAAAPRRRLAVKRGELAEVHPFDVAADAALGEAQRHPGFEVRDHLGLHARMGVQVVVEAVGEPVHECPEPRRAGRVLGLQRVGVDEQPLPQIAPDLRLPVGLRVPPERVQIVGLHPVEVVLGLRVLHAEHGLGIGVAVNVGNAPIVAGDRHRRRLPLPAGDLLLVLGAGNGGNQGRGGRREQQQRLLHHELSSGGRWAGDGVAPNMERGPREGQRRTDSRLRVVAPRGSVWARDSATTPLDPHLLHDRHLSAAPGLRARGTN